MEAGLYTRAPSLAIYSARQDLAYLVTIEPLHGHHTIWKSNGVIIGILRKLKIEDRNVIAHLTGLRGSLKIRKRAMFAALSQNTNSYGNYGILENGYKVY